jgi:hypothetical protein
LFLRRDLGPELPAKEQDSWAKQQDGERWVHDVAAAGRGLLCFVCFLECRD